LYRIIFGIYLAGNLAKITSDILSRSYPAESGVVFDTQICKKCLNKKRIQRKN
jgi:hypothetical protein